MVFLSHDLSLRLRAAHIHPMVWSDHSPISADLSDIVPRPRPASWRINDSILHDQSLILELRTLLDEYFLFNDLPDTSSMTLWEAHKAVVRGHPISMASRRKKLATSKRASLTIQLQTLERQHKLSPDEEVLAKILKVRSDLNLLLSESTASALKRLRQTFYEKGDKADRILASRLRAQRSQNNFMALKSPSGLPIYRPDQIGREFQKFYSTLYNLDALNPGNAPPADTIAAFLRQANLPTLSNSLVQQLNEDITSEEILAVIKAQKSSKAPGPDGFSAAYYKRFSQTLVPHLRSLFNAVLHGEPFPKSMLEARIVVIHKEGKDPSDCASYRPISLLNVDIKLYAKILATRLNGVLPGLIHYDQVGFIPGRQARDNTRRAIDLVQIINQRCLPAMMLSLDAEKAFDRISWEFMTLALKAYGFTAEFLTGADMSGIGKMTWALPQTIYAGKRPSPQYYKNLLTFQFAIEKLNNNSYILPNITLGYHVYDSCNAGNKAIKSVLQILSGPGRMVPNYSCTERGKVIGFIGDHHSEMTVPIAQLLGVYRYSQISYGATHSALGDRRFYPTFFRTLQNDRTIYSMLSKILKYFGWTWIGILASDDDSGDMEVELLTNYVTRRGICVAFTIKMSLNHKDWINKRTAQIISKSNAKVIILCGTFSQTFMRCVDEISDILSDRTIVLSPIWANNKFLIDFFGKIFNGSLLHHYLKNLKYSFDDSPLIFDENGDFITNYQILNWIITKENKVRSWQVGEFRPLDKEDRQLLINESAITWKKGVNQIPDSRCSEMCLPGSRKVPRPGIHTCCYDCAPCSEGEISNTTDSKNCLKCQDDEWPNEKRDLCIPKYEDFLSYTNDEISAVFISVLVFFCFITQLILGIFISHQDTPIVKANNKNLSFLLLVSIMLSFLCVFLFLGRPVDITCMLRQIFFGILFSIAVSSVLAKTIMVCIAFRATKPGSVWRKWMGVKLPNCVVCICSSVQVMICISWLSISPPFQELDTHSYQGQIIVQCNEGSVIGFYSVLGYMGVLAAVSFITAFIARTLPDSFNEAKYITFSMLVFCSVWIAMIPAYLSTKGKYMVAVEIFSILTSNAGLLGCIFFPKCYVILCRPEMNTKLHLLDDRKS
ncbi:vomeronasal type-2 receptor 26-like [Mixophyes fleayi]|uniref:vomeronasal type-2 receptor 26-like n=1 Tax=Mixophyes fleayi TaxID=3061075 RepID=UPI003F4DBB46